MKSSGKTVVLLAGLSLGLLVAPLGLAAQRSSPSGALTPKRRTNFMVYDVQKKTTTTLFSMDGEWHDPNWTEDGRYLVSDMEGALYRIPLSGPYRGKPERIYQVPGLVMTDDHALSWDGGQIAATGIALPMPAKARSASDLSTSIRIMKIDGGAAQEVHQGWLHGWSPDGEFLVYTGTVGDSANIYRIKTDGSGEFRMTSSPAKDDGPEYSADGRWVYFCSNRSGKWDAWRMPAEGAGPGDRLAERITHSTDTQDWFPHLSRDGRWLYTISYPTEDPDHTYLGGGMKIKLLRLNDGIAVKGARLRTIRSFYGGQGSGNTNGWAPDSRKFVWTEYVQVPGAAR